MRIIIFAEQPGCLYRAPEERRALTQIDDLANPVKRRKTVDEIARAAPLPGFDAPIIGGIEGVMSSVDAP